MSRFALRCPTLAGVLLVMGALGDACARAPAVAPVPTIDAETPEWVELFNGRGRDLEEWTPKFAGHPLGVNYNETFRVEDGLLKVRYDRWATFDGEFGHLFYRRRPYSHYVLVAEYRFVEAQVPGLGPELGWALRNNGIMVHAQTPESMGLYQDFPVALEVQLLGGVDHGQHRPTGNLCTPGTQVVMAERRITEHCVKSRSRTQYGDTWVRVEALVLGDSLLRHIVNGDTVLTYSRPHVGGGGVNQPGVPMDERGQLLIEGTPLARGYIAIQAETAPVDFRRIALLNLEGCTDPEAVTYKRYFVKADSTACFYAARP